MYLPFRFLHSAIKTDKIRSQDVRSVFSGVSANPAGFQMAWRQLQMFWPTLVSKFGEGSFTIGSIIQTTISHFSTDFDYKGKKTRNIVFCLLVIKSFLYLTFLTKYDIFLFQLSKDFLEESERTSVQD